MERDDKPSRRRNAGLSKRRSSDDARAIEKQAREERRHRKPGVKKPDVLESGLKAMGEALARRPGPVEEPVTRAEYQFLLQTLRQMRFERDLLRKQHSDIWPPRKHPASESSSTVPVAKITDTNVVEGVIVHAWAEQVWDAEALEWIDLEGGLSGTLENGYAVNGDTSVETPADAIVGLAQSGDDWLILAGGGSGDLKLVTVLNDGGSPGDSSTRCSYTYTVKDYDTSVELGTAIPLTGFGQRVLAAQTFAGTIGLARVRPNTDEESEDLYEIILVWVDEIFVQGECAESDLIVGY